MGIYGIGKQPKFEIRKSLNEQYYFVLVAQNGEPIATSEMYDSKSGCEKGINSVRNNAPKAKIVDTTGLEK